MNKQMWEHAATQRSAERLNKDGVTLLGPASGFQACGEVGMGRMLEPFEIAEQVIAFFQKKILTGKKVLIYTYLVSPNLIKEVIYCNALERQKIHSKKELCSEHPIAIAI